jgi:hypothetical protein
MKEILNIIMKYLDYDSIINISRVIEIPRDILNDGKSIIINPIEFLIYLRDKSQEITDEDRGHIELTFRLHEIEFNVMCITRVFDFHTYRFTFVTNENEYYSFIYDRLIGLNFNEIINVIENLNNDKVSRTKLHKH